MNYSETQITRITRIYVGWTLMIIRFYHIFCYNGKTYPPKEILKDSEMVWFSPILLVPYIRALIATLRCEITSNPPNRPIWFVDAPLWFADAAFCISKHPTSVKHHLHFHIFIPKALHNPNKCLIFAAPDPAKPLNDAQMSGSFFYCHDNKNTI